MILGTRPPRPVIRPPRHAFAATATYAALAMFISYLPFSVANGALGAIGATTSADTHQLAWITDAFTVALTGTVLSGGSFSARFGRRRITTVGLMLTVIASLMAWMAGATSPDGAVIYQLWAGEFIGGMGRVW